MHRTFNIYEAKTHFSEVISSVMGGGEVFIAKAGHPVAKIIPFKNPKPNVKFGVLKGKFRISEDFDEPLSKEVTDLFGGCE